MEQVLVVPSCTASFELKDLKTCGDLALNEADHFRNADFAIPIRNPLSETKKPRASDRETHVAGMHSERGLYACLRKADASTVPNREITYCSRQTVSAQA